MTETNNNNNKNKKIAVTGANGFIGGHCVIALLEAGYDVVGVVRDVTRTDKTDFLADAATAMGKRESLSFASGDLLKPGSYDDAFSSSSSSGGDVVVWGVLHTAAVVNLGASDDPYEEIIRPSIEGTSNVVESLKKDSCVVERFVNVSSVASVAGPPPGGAESHGTTIDDPLILTEEDWNETSSVEVFPYGLAKVEAEKVIRDDDDLRSKMSAIVNINPSVVLGPPLTVAQAMSDGLSCGIVKGALAGGGLPWPAEVLLERTSYVDVRDVANAVVLAFEKKLDDSGVVTRFILSEDEPRHYDAMNEAVKKSHPAAAGFTDPLPETVLPHNADEIRFDNDRSKTVLGLKYRSFEESCVDTADAYLALLPGLREHLDAVAAAAGGEGGDGDVVVEAE